MSFSLPNQSMERTEASRSAQFAMEPSHGGWHEIEL